ncbi:MAG TPA: Ku protein [Ramlibacter sp.]|nr:Ku protein [Ramlibacter sp.]
MADTQGMAKTSTRALWKGAITFGLVHIPIGLYSATAESEVNFDWLDKRTMDPVGYKRVNKKTGREIAKDDIVKGVQYRKGEYVVLTREEIEEAYPRTTQTIEIESFVDIDEVPFVYLEKPYYTAPVNKGEKVYALLREALRQTGKAGIGKVVIQAKQHLAIVLPCGPALVVNLLRWGGEIRSWEDLNLPPSSGKAAGIKEAELKMAKQLIEGMSGRWKAGEFRDSFHDAIMQLVEKKAEAGETETVQPLEEAPAQGGADVLDLTELLRRSLRGGKREPAAKPARTGTRRAAPRERAAASASTRTPRKKTTARKSARTQGKSRRSA